MQIPEIVEQIIITLQGHGYEGYAVGGCVRDTLLGREPKDWDITTSALPEQVKALFPRTIDTGIQHGTVTVMYGREGYEVTTYRIDGEYEDGRHPKEVSFTSDLLEDLKRRDFTINAMAYSPQTGIVDAFDGRADLEQGRIRCVGDPMERFTEDALRILRAIRFSAQLGFSIDEATWEAVKAIAPNIAKVSKERIQMELTKMLLSSRPEQIRQVYEAGISEYISPAFAGVPWQQSQVSSLLPEEKYIRWASWLLRLSVDDAVEILKDLKFDNDTIRKAQTLVLWCSQEIRPDKPSVRRGMSRMDGDVWNALLELKASLTDDGSIAAVKHLTAEIRESGDCLGLADLAVKGQDLLAIGMKPGRQVGEILHLMLERVLEHPEDNNQEFLLQYIKQFSNTR